VRRVEGNRHSALGMETERLKIRIADFTPDSVTEARSCPASAVVPDLPRLIYTCRFHFWSSARDSAPAPII
jgi:hypothetical protein